MRWVCIIALCTVLVEHTVVASFDRKAHAASSSIAVPATIRVESGVESALPIEVYSPADTSKQIIILITGIPAVVSLTEGRLFPSGVWAIKPVAIGRTRIVAAPNTVEQSNISISLVALNGEYLSTTSSYLVIEPKRQGPSLPAANAPTNSVGVAAIATREPAPDTNSPKLNHQQNDDGARFSQEVEKILKLMAKGDRYFSEGKIGFARRFYQLAADLGWSDGAIAMARTYDPLYLARFSLLGGIEPDKAVAQEWYNKSEGLPLGFREKQSKK